MRNPRRMHSLPPSAMVHSRVIRVGWGAIGIGSYGVHTFPLVLAFHKGCLYVAYALHHMYAREEESHFRGGFIPVATREPSKGR